MFNACCKGIKSWSKLRTLTSKSNIHGTLITFTSSILLQSSKYIYLLHVGFSLNAFSQIDASDMKVTDVCWRGRGRGGIISAPFSQLHQKNQCKSVINESPGHELMSSAVRSDTSLSSNRMRNNENLCIWEEWFNLKQLRSFEAASAKHTV